MNTITIRELSNYFGVRNVTDFKKRLKKMNIYPLIENKSLISQKDAEKAKANWYKED